MADTPQMVGTAPHHLVGATKEQGSKCAKTVCKVLFPALIGVAVILLVLLLVRLLTKKRDGNAPAPPAVQYAAVPQQRAFPRNVPRFPVQQQQQPQQPSGPQAYNNGNMQFSSYKSGPAAGNGQVAKMLDQRYVQAESQPYSDNKMSAYQNYAEVVGSQGQAQNWDEAAFNKLVLQQKIPALVAFTMSGCGHCERLKPAFAEAAKHAKIALAMVERGSAGSLPEKYQVRGFPTIILFQGGEAIKVYQGDRSVDSLVQFAQ